MPSLKVCPLGVRAVRYSLPPGQAEASGACANLERESVLTPLLQPAVFHCTANRLSRHLISGQEQVKHTAMADRGLARRNELDVKAIIAIGG